MQVLWCPEQQLRAITVAKLARLSRLAGHCNVASGCLQLPLLCTDVPSACNSMLQVPLPVMWNAAWGHSYLGAIDLMHASQAGMKQLQLKAAFKTERQVELA